MSEKTEERRGEVVRVPLSMPAELDAKITAASTQIKLSKQDTMRLSLERGLNILVAQLTTEPQTA